MSNSTRERHLGQMVQNEDEDRLSSLPDDILVSILQLIDINDATRTSILSRRWRYLAPYSYFTLLDLDATTNTKTHFISRSYNDVKPKFLNWVHHVLTSHRAPSVTDFRICFTLSQVDSNCFSTWINFACLKGVNKLELDFSYLGFSDFDEYPDFSLRYEDHLCFKNMNAGWSSNNLTSLCLRFVNISGELLELLLSHFRLLERLCIECSHELQNLKIINSSEKLKHLAVHRCTFLKEIEIHAVSLVSFELLHRYESYYFGDLDDHIVNVIYASVPSLVDARFCLLRCDTLRPYFLHMHCLAAQLTKLNLQMINCSYGDPHLLPSFPNVKDLELQVSVGHHRFDWNHMNLLRLRRYVEACPVLDNLKLQIIWTCDCDQLYHPESDVDFDSDYDSDFDLDSDSGPEEYNLEEVKQWLEEKEGVNAATLPLLRKLEWSAVFSHHVEAEYQLALYFVKNAVMLEKFICDPRLKDENWDYYDSMNVDRIEDEVDVRRQRARNLATAIPSRIDFIIL